MAQAVENLAILPGGSFLRYATPMGWVDNKLLATAGTAEAIAVPAGATIVVFCASASFAARLNATLGGTAAAVADTADGTGCEINPAGYRLAGVAEISVVGFANDTRISATFYKGA